MNLVLEGHSEVDNIDAAAWDSIGRADWLRHHSKLGSLHFSCITPHSKAENVV